MNLFCRPVFFAGLFCMVLLYLYPVCSQEKTLPQQLQLHLVYVPQSLFDLPDSAQVRFGTTFAPLYSEKDLATNGDSQLVALEAHGVTAGLYSRYKQLRYFVACSHDGGEAALRQRESGYSLIHERSEWNFTSAVAYRYRNLHLGFGLGRHWPKYMERDHLRGIGNDVGGYVVRGPWQVSLCVKGDFRRASAWLSLFSGPVHSSVVKLVTGDEARFRSFPLSIVRHSIDAGLEVTIASVATSTQWGIDFCENADLQTVENTMPQDVAISNFRLVQRGGTRLAWTDSLWWEVSGSLAGGWGASYNFHRERFTFFKAATLRQYNVCVGGGVKLPHGMTSGLFQAWSSATSTSGFLKLSVLSAWSIFQSLDYKYKDAALSYGETGVFLNRTFSRLFFECTPQFKVSYVKTQMVFSRTRKEIVVLLPVYGDAEEVEVFNTPLVLVDPSVSVVVRWGRLVVNAALHQMVPIVPYTTNTESSDEGKETLVNYDTKITGGTRVSLGAMWNIPQFGVVKRK